MKDPRIEARTVELLKVSDEALALVRALKIAETSRNAAGQLLEAGGSPDETEEEKISRYYTFKYLQEKLDWYEFERRVGQLYDARFTPEQLKEILVFAETPTGRAFIEKSGEINLAAAEITERMLMASTSKVAMYIRDNTPLGANEATQQRAGQTLYEAQMLTEMLMYYAEATKAKPGDAVTYEQLQKYIPPEELVLERQGKDTLGNPFVFGKVGEPVRVSAESRKAFEPVVEAVFWGRYGEGAGEGGDAGVKPIDR